MKAAMWRGFNPDFNARVVAVCDLDSNRMANAKSELEKFYKEKGESKVDIKTHGDFRQLLARKDIDAVIIVTPDHWHALLGIAAADAGTHMYLEKPLTYTIPEGRALVEAVGRNNVVLQTGSHQRSSKRFRRACEIIRNNWLGELKSIEVMVPTDSGTASAEPMPVPQSLNYDMWLGPSKEMPYTEARVHPQQGFGRPGWLQIELYSRGMVTGWGAHMYDIAQWAMGTDNTGPIEVACKGEFPDRGLFDVHVGYEGEALYANGVRMTSRAAAHGVRFITEKGWVYVDRGKSECSNPDLLLREPGEGEVSLYSSRDHMENFLSSAREGKEPITPAEVGHRSNTICVLHHHSMKLGGRKIKWDPVTETIVGDSEAAALLEVPMRAPWSI